MSRKHKTPLKKKENIPFARGWSRVQLGADLEAIHAKEWAKAVKNYENDPNDFYHSYEFLSLHPANIRRFPREDMAGTPEPWFEENLSIAVVKVDPKTKRIETKGNTETNVWLEWGPYEEESESHSDPCAPEGGTHTHDPRTDTGGRTFEEAMVNLANNVYHLYGGHARVPDDKKLSKKLRK